MIDFEKARITMVDCQIRPNDVTSYPVLEAFGSVPREAFVPKSLRSIAYIDEDIVLPAENGQRYLMEAMSMSRMVQLAEITADDIVLDVGCGTGYSSAVLSQLCNSVVAIESDPTLAELATKNLLDQGHDNVVVLQAPLEKGLAKEGPFDVIFFGGAVEELPATFKDQLKDGGRMVVVEGTGNTGIARIYLRVGDVVSGRNAFNCAVKPLPGFEKTAEFAF